MVLRRAHRWPQADPLRSGYQVILYRGRSVTTNLQRRVQPVILLTLLAGVAKGFETQVFWPRVNLVWITASIRDGEVRPHGRTAIYDAMAEALQMFRTRFHQFAVIVQIPDGFDTTSSTEMIRVRVKGPGEWVVRARRQNITPPDRWRPEVDRE